MNAPPDTQSLLTHLAWIRGLALDLVRDAAEAEDVAQDALVLALEHPPRESVAWRGYLRVLMRNAFLQRRRADTRRAARERAGAREEATPSAADSVERLATHREVVAAIEALPEPLRQTILLRYFDELPPREIAARLSMPVKTVNTRLHRAHQLLRTRLDESHGGDRRSWALALTGLVARERRAPAGPSPTTARLALGASALVLAVAIGSWIGHGTRAPDPVEVAAGGPAESAAIAADNGLEPPSEAGSRRTIAAAEPRGELRGRVRTAAGEPIAGAEVIARFRPFDGMKLRLGSYGASVEEIGRVRSGADGRFGVGVPDDRALDVLVRASGFGILRRPLVAATSELDLVLSKAGAIACEVLDPKGHPVADAQVELCPAGEPWTTRDPWILGRTDAKGRWSSSDVAPGVYLMTIRTPNGGPTHVRNVPARAGEVTERKVLLSDGRVVEGTVRAVGTGEPLAGCAVGVGVYDNRCATTDDRGRFRIERIGRGGMELWATADGRGDLSLQILDRRDEARLQVDFELPRGHEVTGTLLRPDGSPISGAWIGAYAERGGPHLQRDWAEARSDESGAFTLAGVRDDLRHALLVRSPGSAMTIALLADAGARIDLGPVRIETGARIEGVVRRDDGSAAAGAIVTAQRIDVLPSLAAPGAPPTEWSAGTSTTTTAGVSITKGSATPQAAAGGEILVLGDLLETCGVAGDDGRFRILDLAPGRYRVLARIGWLRSALREIDLAPGAITSDQIFEVVRGLSLEGTVVGEDGEPLPGAWVLLYQGAEHLEKRSEVADEAGRFRMEGLEAVPYRIEAGYSTSTPRGDAIQPYARTKLLDVVPPRSNVVLRLPKTIRVEGRVIDTRGRPLAHTVVNFRDPEGRNPQATADAEGRFGVDLVRGTVLDVEGSWPGAFEMPPDTKRLSGKLEGVVAGSGEIVLRLE